MLKETFKMFVEANITGVNAVEGVRIVVEKFPEQFPAVVFGPELQEWLQNRLKAHFGVSDELSIRKFFICWLIAAFDKCRSEDTKMTVIQFMEKLAAKKDPGALEGTEKAFSGLCKDEVALEETETKEEANQKALAEKFGTLQTAVDSKADAKETEVKINALRETQDAMIVREKERVEREELKRKKDLEIAELNEQHEKEIAALNAEHKKKIAAVNKKYAADEKSEPAAPQASGAREQ